MFITGDHIMTKIIPLPLTDPMQVLREFPYITTTERTAKHSDVFLDGDIDEPSDYRELIAILFNAMEYDTVNIFINSPGGNLDTALSIIEGIRNSPAYVSAFLIGACHSAASMIALTCDQLIITDSANMLVHSASFGSAGTTGNVKSHTDFVVKQTNKLLDHIYEGFLSKEEIEDVKLGVELWLDAGEIKKRIQKRLELMESRAKKVNKKNKKS